MNHNLIAQICPYHQRFYIFTGLRNLFLKITYRLPPDPVSIFFQNIQKPIGIMIPETIVNNGNLNGFDFITAFRLRGRIFTKLHTLSLLPAVHFQNPDIMIGLPQYMIRQQRQNHGSNAAVQNSLRTRRLEFPVFQRLLQRLPAQILPGIRFSIFCTAAVRIFPTSGACFFLTTAAS